MGVLEHPNNRARVKLMNPLFKIISTKRRLLVVASLTIICSFAGTYSSASDWPQFRGPAGDGLTAEKQLPAEWGKDKNIQWKVKVPGVAWSCPIIWGDKLIVTTAITENQKKPTVPQFGPG